MKIKLPSFIQSLLLMILLTILFSLLSSFLYSMTWISSPVFHGIHLVGGYIVYLAGGCWLGIHLTKKAAWIILLSAIALLLPILLRTESSLLASLLSAIKPLLFGGAAFLLFLRKQKD